MAGPLEGLKVVDFSRVLAGPLCARTLQDLGAEVTKIEPPRADVSRFSAPINPNGMSGYYAQQNAGKRNISVDLSSREGIAVVLDLVAAVDVVLENYRPGVMERLGLGGPQDRHRVAG